jgi:hypothetical protein
MAYDCTFYVIFICNIEIKENIYFKNELLKQMKFKHKVHIFNCCLQQLIKGGETPI